jgi:hypothetical protein
LLLEEEEEEKSFIFIKKVFLSIGGFFPILFAVLPVPLSLSRKKL